MEIVLVTKNGNEPERRRKLDLRDKNDLLLLSSGIDPERPLQSLLDHPATTIQAKINGFSSIVSEIGFLNPDKKFNDRAASMNEEVLQRLIDPEQNTIACATPFFTPGMALAAIETARQKFGGRESCNIVFFPSFDQNSYKLSEYGIGLLVNHGFLVDQDGRVYYGDFGKHAPIAKWLDYNFITQQERDLLSQSGVSLISGYYDAIPSGSKAAVFSHLAKTDIRLPKTVVVSRSTDLSEDSDIEALITNANISRDTKVAIKPSSGSGGWGISYSNSSNSADIFSKTIELIRYEQDVVIQEFIQSAPLQLSEIGAADWNLRVIVGDSGILLTEARVHAKGERVNKHLGARIYETYEILDMVDWHEAFTYSPTNFETSINQYSQQIRAALGIGIVALDLIVTETGEIYCIESNKGCFGGIPSIAEIRLKDGDPLSATRPLIQELSELKIDTSQSKDANICLRTKLFDPLTSHPSRITSYITMLISDAVNSQVNHFRLNFIDQQIQINPWGLDRVKLSHLFEISAWAHNRIKDDANTSRAIRASSYQIQELDPEQDHRQRVEILKLLNNEDWGRLLTALEQPNPLRMKERTHLKIKALYHLNERENPLENLSQQELDSIGERNVLFYQAVAAYGSLDAENLWSIVNLSFERATLDSGRDKDIILFARLLVGYLDLIETNPELASDLAPGSDSQNVDLLCRSAYDLLLNLCEFRKKACTGRFDMKNVTIGLQKLIDRFNPNQNTGLAAAKITGSVSREWLAFQRQLSRLQLLKPNEKTNDQNT